MFITYLSCITVNWLHADIQLFFTVKIENSVLLKPRNVIEALVIFEHFPSFFFKKFNTCAVVHQKKYFNSICVLLILIIC